MHTRAPWAVRAMVCINLSFRVSMTIPLTSNPPPVLRPGGGLLASSWDIKVVTMETQDVTLPRRVNTVPVPVPVHVPVPVPVSSSFPSPSPSPSPSLSPLFPLHKMSPFCPVHKMSSRPCPRPRVRLRHRPRSYPPYFLLRNMSKDIPVPIYVPIPVMPFAQNVTRERVLQFQLA